uniref:Uncharacterized protein n=1 Tax=Timema monikensis TaxID=170555 RepID=A0A7R9EDT4_9NEOP|nr:unnamed protein product [Timema monikensis]
MSSLNCCFDIFKRLTAVDPYCAHFLRAAIKISRYFKARSGGTRQRLPRSAPPPPPHDRLWVGEGQEGQEEGESRSGVGEGGGGNNSQSESEKAWSHPRVRAWNLLSARWLVREHGNQTLDFGLIHRYRAKDDGEYEGDSECEGDDEYEGDGGKGSSVLPENERCLHVELIHLLPVVF